MTERDDELIALNDLFTIPKAKVKCGFCIDEGTLWLFDSEAELRTHVVRVHIFGRTP